LFLPFIYLQNYDSFFSSFSSLFKTSFVTLIAFSLNSFVVFSKTSSPFSLASDTKSFTFSLISLDLSLAISLTCSLSNSLISFSISFIFLLSIFLTSFALMFLTLLVTSSNFFFNSSLFSLPLLGDNSTPAVAHTNAPAAIKPISLFFILIFLIFLSIFSKYFL